MKRLLVLATMATGLLIAGCGGEEGPGGGPRRGRPALAVETAPVARETMRDVARFTGSLSPRSRFVIAPKVGGRLERLTVDIGDAVQAGQLIAELDQGEYRLQVQQAQAELAVAKASVAEGASALEVADRELERMVSLRQKEMASEAELDETRARRTACQAKYDVFLAEVERRQAALAAAEVRLSYTRVQAAWGEDGAATRVVGERFVDEGETLRAYDPIVSILDNSVVIAAVDVTERDYPRIAVGQPALVAADAFPDESFAGRIARITPLLSEASRQARVEIEVPNQDDRLRPGMFARVEIEFGRHADAAVVPLAAVVRRQGQRGVFLADREARQARFVPVTVGLVGGDRAEILEPELNGEVITLGHHLLEDGAPIIPPGAEPAPAADRKKKGPPGGRP